jgi:hypothetical protein
MDEKHFGPGITGTGVTGARRRWRRARCAVEAGWAAGLLALLGACASAPDWHRLSHPAQRVQYAFTEAELKGLQYYVARDVLARVREAGESSPRQGEVILVPRGTPGEAVEVGPNWLRVRFSSAGTGVLWVASDDVEDGVYYLGKEVNGEIRRLKDLNDRVIVHEGTTYELDKGETAYLLVGGEGLNNLIESRQRTKGVRLDAPETK